MLVELMRRQPWTKSVADALTTPYGVDGFLSQWSRTRRAGDQVRAEVVAVDRSVPRTVLLTLRPNTAWRGFHGGQWVVVGVDVDGRRKHRTFSIASSSHTVDGTFQLGVRENPEGTVSGWLVRHARPGLVVSLSQAEGDFQLPDRRPEQLLMVTGGSGVTPVMGLLRTLRHERHAGRVEVLHYTRTRDEVLFADELADLAAGLPATRVRVSTTREDVEPVDGDLRGHFAPEHVAPDVGGVDPTRAHLFLCGPEALVDAVSAWWRDVAGPDAEERLHVETFRPSDAPGTVHGEGGGTVRFATSGTEVTDDGRSLLEQAEDAGLEPAYGCRMGICRTCIRPVTEGHVRNIHTGDLTGDGAEATICVSVAAGDVTLDL